MAEKKRDPKIKTAAELDADLDEHIEKVFEKNKNYKYTGGLTSETVDEVRTHFLQEELIPPQYCHFETIKL
jgi:hypothetical protein